MNHFSEIIIHHSASPRKTTINDIRGWHKAKGWSDIGYHYVIEDDGEVLVGRRLPETGAHAPPNAGRIGICVVGANTSNGDRWGPAQWAALVDLTVSLLTVFPWIGINGVKRHSDTKATKCPGLSPIEWDEFCLAVQRRIG